MLIQNFYQVVLEHAQNSTIPPTRSEWNSDIKIETRDYTQKEYNKTKCYFYSKQLVMHLNEKYNVPLGKKKGKLHIPSQIFITECFLKACIRGLFDTDGSIHRHHKRDIMAGIASGDMEFLNEIKQAMDQLGIHSYKGTRNVYIYSKKDIKKFFSEVTPSNLKHLQKYKLFLRKGELPLITSFR